jgi:hypothetical protein
MQIDSLTCSKGLSTREKAGDEGVIHLGTQVPHLSTRPSNITSVAYLSFSSLPLILKNQASSYKNIGPVLVSYCVAYTCRGVLPIYLGTKDRQASTRTSIYARRLSPPSISKASIHRRNRARAFVQTSNRGPLKAGYQAALLRRAPTTHF